MKRRDSQRTCDNFLGRDDDYLPMRSHAKMKVRVQRAARPIQTSQLAQDSHRNLHKLGDRYRNRQLDADAALAIMGRCCRRSFAFSPEHENIINFM